MAFVDREITESLGNIRAFILVNSAFLWEQVYPFSPIGQHNMNIDHEHTNMKIDSMLQYFHLDPFKQKT